MGMKFASEAAKQAFLQGIVNGILAQQNASNPASGIPQQQAAAVDNKLPQDMQTVGNAPATSAQRLAGRGVTVENKAGALGLANAWATTKKKKLGA